MMTDIKLKNRSFYFYYLPIFILFTKGFIMVHAENENIYYGVDIDLNNVGVDIRVNDIPVFFDDNKGQLVLEVPVPDSIIDGENVISVKASLPFDGNDYVKKYAFGAYVSATLFKQNTTVKNAPKINITKVYIQLNNDMPVSTVENIITKEQSSPEINYDQYKNTISKSTVKIISPFPRWNWQDGKVIDNDQQSYNSLLSAYKKIYDALKNKNIEQLKSFYSERASETAIAYHLSNEDAGQEKLSVGRDMADNSLELYEFHNLGLELQILGNGKLARLADDIGAQPILYTQKDGAAVHLYKFMFYLNSSNKWILIR